MPKPLLYCLSEAMQLNYPFRVYAEASRRRKLSKNEDSIGNLLEKIEKLEQDRDDHIRQLSREIDTIKGKNEELQGQFTASQAATHEIIQRFEEIQQRLVSLTSSGGARTSQPGTEEAINIPTQDKQLAWWKRLVYKAKNLGQVKRLAGVKVLIFILAYMFFEMSSNAVANIWTAETAAEWLFIAAVFLVSLGILTYAGLSALNNLPLKGQ